MKSIHSIKVALLFIALFGFARVFADTVAHTAGEGNVNEAQESATIEKTDADTAAENAKTAAMNANTAAENANTAAENVNTEIKMVTVIPTPKETVSVPSGFASCFVFKAGLYRDMWIPDHRVCQYNPPNQGVVWIEGYWACTNYKSTGSTSGECTKWDWRAAHWGKTFDVY